jgi:hypothetical protein
MTFPRRSWLVAGCCAIAIASALAESAPAQPASLASLLAKMDTTGLAAREPVFYPGTLAWNATVALAPARAGSALAGETFETLSADARRTTARSPHYRYEWRPAAGAAFLQWREDVPIRPYPVPGGQAGAVDDAVRRLTVLGVVREEITLVRKLPLVSQTRTEDGTHPTPPRVEAWKVFLERRLGGTVVDGSRAVFTYTPDGTFIKALIRWPSLDPDASRHRPNAGVAPIEAAAAVARHLIETDRTDVDGAIVLAFSFTTEDVLVGAEQRPAVRLTRKVAAALEEARTAPETGIHERVRVVEVDPRPPAGL